MKRTYLALASLSLMAMASISTPALADSVTLCAGSPGRNYDSVMKSIGAELSNRGHDVKLLNLKGSEDILNHLDNGTCDYGPAQKDVHYSLSKKNSGFAATVTPISLLYNEAMVAFCSAESGIDELEEFDEGTKVIIDSIGSGSAMSWETMVNVEKEYGNSSAWVNAQTEYLPLDEAIAAISIGNADCAYGVGAVPSNWAKALDEAGMSIVWLEDKDINDLQVGKSSLYPAVRVPYGAYSTKFDTYAVPAILFRSNKNHIKLEIDNIVKRLAPSIGKKYNTVQ